MFFRAFYAVRQLTSPKGLPVNAIYGFLSMMIKLLKEEKPEYLVFCYDRKEPSFRKDMYSEYKANRTEMPEELGVQIPYIKKLGELLGVPAFEIPQYEADDIIGTLTKIAADQKFEVIIVSGDKDFGQLIRPHVYLYDTMKEIRYDVPAVKEKWGIRPDQFLDYLALVGDTSDNIPGVQGVGPKGAIKLLEQFKHLEDIYERIDEVSAKSLKEKLMASKENAFLSKKLVKIVDDVPMSKDMSTYRLQPMKRSELRSFLQELNFKTFEKNLLGAEETAAPTLSGLTTENAPSVDSSANPDSSRPPQDSQLIERSSENEVEKVELGHWLKDSNLSTPLNQFALPEMVSMDVPSFIDKVNSKDEIYFFKDERGFYALINQTVFALTTIRDDDFLPLGPALEKKEILFSGFDLKEIFHTLGCQNPRHEWDSMLAAYVLEATDCNDFDKVYARLMKVEEQEFASPAQKAQMHLHLRDFLQTELKKTNAFEVYKKFELPLILILYKMEKLGVRLDAEELARQSHDLAIEIKELEQAIHKDTGEVFNVSSPKQLATILFEKMGLEAGKKTKTGYSTDIDVLEKLDHPVGRKIIEFRELTKLKSTYVDALPSLIHVTDHRVHTHFNQALTATGRLSSTEPNLQNIPIKTAKGQKVRQAFIAEPGCELLSVDYSQVELRVLAHMSEDPGLIRSFQEDLDIHTATAAEIFEVPLDQVTSQLRRTAKAVNFGIAYGQGAFGLAENLGIERKEAQGIIERYFTRFKNVKDYIDSTIQKAHELGYVETLFGRRRYIHELRAKNQAVKKFGERAAINAPIQGTASDIVKLAMIEIDKKISVPMLLQVHDELIFEAPKSKLETQSNLIKDIMENVVQLKVPLKVNLAIGKNWDEAH